MLRHQEYLKAGLDVLVATGYDPLLDNEPELAPTMAASVTQRIAFGNALGKSDNIPVLLPAIRPVDAQNKVC